MSADRIILKSDPWDGGSSEGGDLEFRLTYAGKLFSENNKQSPDQRGARATHKHELRKVFHPQLKRLWENTHYLNEREPNEPPGSFAQQLGNNFARNGYRFVPLVTKSLSLHCSLDVLFLRTDPPGALLTSGDMDNRLKTLFDALCMPRDAAQLGKYVAPDQGEDPFFCLLEDDRMINNLSVQTDVLLEPAGQTFDVNDARLVIKVTVKPYRYGWGNIDFI